MDELLHLTNVYIVDPLLGIHEKPAMVRIADQHVYDPQYGLWRQFFVLTCFLYVNSVFVYLLGAGSTYVAFFTRKFWKDGDTGRSNRAFWKYDGAQIREEVVTSLWSMFIMSGLTAPFELLIMYGYGKTYDNVSERGWWFLPVSIIGFLIFTDSLIYWIHRWLHWGIVYKYIHKLHHKYKQTTPWSAFSFHPIDGWSQSIPYHLYVLFFPMHNYLYTATLFVVALWTINIHDRVTFDIWGVNGAAHHTMHHEKFNYNYGQYFVFWDWVFGTYKDPYAYVPYNRSPYKRPYPDGSSLCEEPSKTVPTSTLESPAVAALSRPDKEHAG
jgi:lathosterol oxidase